MADDLMGSGYQASKGVAGTVAEKAQSAVKQAGDLGSEALDQIDTWLKPAGLSLRANPGLAIAVIAGVAAVAGAVLMSRSRPTTSQRISDEAARLAKRAGLL